MVAVAVDERGQQTPQELWQANGYTIPLAVDVDGSDKYGIRAIPVTLIIDAQGNIVEQFKGAIDGATLEAAIVKAL